ncbi:MAG: hypothetical protein U9N39_07560 [Campylobacterota bacterium]|nr:hypothetical protein [Campylobacterota bacterium]
MTAIMVKMGNGFFIPKLDGFDDIQKDTISVNIDLTQEEHSLLSYKELKGIAIIEKYYQKLENEIEVDNSISDVQKEFRKNNNINMSLENYLTREK